LSFLGIDAFHAYQALQHVYVGRNHIQTIAPHAFRALRNLQILDLEANRLRTVPTPTFGHIPSVRILSLKSNPITYIISDAFHQLVNLEELNLENCWLNRVQPGAFAGLAVLSELNLVNNELAGLPAETQSDLPSSLTVLRLHRNPWKCDCRLRWLRRFVDAGGRSSSSSINWDFAAHNTPVCSGPQLLRGVSWRHLTADQFACPPTQVVGNGTTSVELHVGANSSIACVVAGDPPPVVTWMKGTKYVSAEQVAQRTEMPSGEDEPPRLHSLLRLTGVTPADAGDYKCVAANPAGRSEVTYKVWVVDGIARVDKHDKPRGGRVADTVDGVHTSVGVSIEVVFGAAVGVTVLVAALCACAAVVVARKRRVLQNFSRVRKERSAGNSYVLAASTPASMKSSDDVVITHETTAVEMNCRQNHDDGRHIPPNAVVAIDDAESISVESVHVSSFQFAASRPVPADSEHSPSKFSMKIFAANPRPVADNSPSPKADATPSPPPPDTVQFPENDAVIESPSDALGQRSAEPDGSSPCHIDDSSPCHTEDEEDDCSGRFSDRSKNVSTTSPHSPSSSTSHAVHCANPVCLRERLLDRSSSSLPSGDMCSHRLALSNRTSSPDHGRVRVAVLQRHRCSPSNAHDVVDGAGSLPCRPSSVVRTSSRRNSSSRTSDVSYYSTLPLRRMTDSDKQPPRLRTGYSHYVTADCEPHRSTMPRQHQRMSTAIDRRQQSTSPTGKLSGSSSALDIRDLEIASTSSPHSMTFRAKSPAIQSTIVATSLHDILSPPFGPPTANGPKPTTGNALHALKLKPGEQDEFGTAV